MRSGFMQGTVYFGLGVFVVTLGLILPLDLPATDRPKSFSEMTDEKQLLIIDWLPLGSRFEDLRKHVPDAPEPEHEVGGVKRRRVLTGSSFEAVLLGQRAKFEMHYENGQLYSTFRRLKGIFDAATSDSIEAKVSRLYSARLGTPNISEAADCQYVTRTHSWCWNGGSAHVAVFGVEKSHRSIAGGFQVLCPDDQSPPLERYIPIPSDTTEFR
jgi:hypothetical protein